MFQLLSPSINALQWGSHSETTLKGGILLKQVQLGRLDVSQTEAWTSRKRPTASIKQGIFKCINVLEYMFAAARRG